MRHRPSRWCAALGAAVVSASAALHAAPTIGDLAPENCFLVASVGDMAGARAALERTNLIQLWNEPDVQRAVKAFRDANTDLGPWLANFEFDALSLPDVSLGYAMFIGANDDAEDPDAADAPQSILVADYGEDQDSAAALHDAILGVFEEAEKLGEADLEPIDVGGVECTRVVIDYEAVDERLNAEFMDEEDDMGAEEDDEFGEEEWWAEEEFGLADRDLPRNVYFARVGAVVVAASQRDAFEDALDRLAGADLGPTAGDSETLRAALAQHTSPHGYAALLIAPLIESLRGPHDSPIAGLIDEFQPMFLDSLEWIEPAATALGLDKVRAISVGLRLDSPDAMTETTIAALVPEKGELFSLFDGEAAPFAPPAVIGPDAASVFSMRFNFDRVLPLARNVGAQLPEPQRGSMLAQLDAFEQQVGPILSALGSRFTVARRYERPFGPESQKTLIVADIRDQQALTDALGAVAPMFGAQSRDFLGAQIWESAFLPDFALSVTAGGMLAGDSPSVEAAIRESAEAARPKLADEARFTQATRALRPGIAHAWTDFRASLEYTSWLEDNMEQIVAQQLEEMGVDEEFREEYLQTMRDAMPEWQRLLPGPDVMLRYFGDTVGELRTTPEGAVYRVMQLRPSAP